MKPFNRMLSLAGFAMNLVGLVLFIMLIINRGVDALPWLPVAYILVLAGSAASFVAWQTRRRHS